MWSFYFERCKQPPKIFEDNNLCQGMFIQRGELPCIFLLVECVNLGIEKDVGRFTVRGKNYHALANPAHQFQVLSVNFGTTAWLF